MKSALPAPRRLRIGFDLDGVIDLDYYKRMERWFRRYTSLAAARDLTGNGLGFRTVWVENTLGCTPEEAGRLVGDFMSSSLGFTVAKPLGAVPALRELAAVADFYIITSRDKYWETETLDWLKAVYGNIFAGVYWSNYMYVDRPKASKLEICQELKLDVYVDDRPDYIAELAGSLWTILFGEFQWTERDESLVTGLPGVLRARKWPAVRDRILEIRDELSLAS
jgi:hypothetical protein